MFATYQEVDDRTEFNWMETLGYIVSFPVLVVFMMAFSLVVGAFWIEISFLQTVTGSKWFRSRSEFREQYGSFMLMLISLGFHIFMFAG